MKKTIFALLLIGFCANAKADTYQEYSNKAKALVDGITSVASSDLSCVSDSDCEAIESGSRSCGGPNRHIITSKNNIALAILKDLIKLETSYESQMNAELGLMSICSFESPPSLKCQKNICSESAR